MELLRALDIHIDPSLPAISSTHGLIASLQAQAKPLLIVTASTRRAEEIAAEMRVYLGDRIVEFPPWETLPHERLSPKSDTIVARYKAIHALKNDSKIVAVVTSIRGLIQPISPAIQSTEPLS